MPSIRERDPQPYAGVSGRVTMATIGSIADRIPEVFGWLAERGIAPVGAPFFRYEVIDLEHELRLLVGVPVAEVPAPAGDVVTGTLPGGRFVTETHVGDFSELEGVTRELLTWAWDANLKFDMTQQDDGEHWACRLESYPTDIRHEPDKSKWQTVLEFKLAD
jgi:effector-binding domain-containing protein